MSRVVIKDCASYEPDVVRAALNEALAAFPEIIEHVAGARVIVKANLVSMMKPESAATTHPALLYELCRFLVERGADVVVGDSPGGMYNAPYVNAVYRATGVTCVTKAGARLNNNFEHKLAANPDGHALKELEYTTYLDDADIIINFCKLKTHGMMGMSACVKNMFGAIPGTFKPEYHYKYPDHNTFANMLIDLNERFKPALCLVDAVTAMEGNGPTAGTPRFVGALLASDSPYDCDRVCAKLIGLDPDNVATVSCAKERGLESEPELIGDYTHLIVPDFKLVRQVKDVGFSSSGHGFFGTFITKALCSVPAVNKSECIGCRKCAEICPAKAIEMQNKKPAIARSKCIRCFCCQEFCPKGAMKVKRPLIARLINR